MVTISPSVSFSAGLYTYSYAISIIPDSDEGIYQFDLLNLAGLSSNTVLGSPANWTAVPDFTGLAISWISDNYAADAFATPVAGFSFTSPNGPGTVSYAVSIEDSFSNLSSGDGTTSGPTTVPEPASGGACAAALLGLAWFKRRAFRACFWGSLPIAMMAAPSVQVKVAGAPAWAPDISIRAAKPAILDASGSTGTGGLTFLWQQISGPNTLRFSSRTVAAPTITGAIFGSYVVRVSVSDGTGTSMGDLRFGAVGTDDLGVVTPPTKEQAILFAPLIRWGASPWAWVDERHRFWADTLGDAIANNPNYNGLDWDTLLGGTVALTPGTTVVTGTNTQFQTDFCAGGTVAPQDTNIVFWQPNASGTGRREYQVAGCPTQTSLTLVRNFVTSAAPLSGVGYSKWLCRACWANGSSNINYYDNVLAYYSLYYRSGRIEYLNSARLLARNWWRAPYLDEGRSYTTGGFYYPIPRVASLLGVIWYAYETNDVALWAQLYPALDTMTGSWNTAAPISDVREEGAHFAFLALAARLAPSGAKRTSYASAVQNGLTNRWVPFQTAAGYYVYPLSPSSGLAAVTNGSDVVTLTGRTITPGDITGLTDFYVCNNSTCGSGDASKYRVASYVDPSSFRLATPYTGGSTANRYYQLGTVVGPGFVQPFFQGIAAHYLEIAYRSLGIASARTVASNITQWLQTNGQENSTKGFYYVRVAYSCEPVLDIHSDCAFDPALPDDVSASRYLNGQSLFAYSSQFTNNPSAGLLLNGDFLTGAAMGKLGGPSTDSAYVQNLEWAFDNGRFKDFGFFFGTGGVAQWSAARTGTATSQINGR